MDTSKEWTLLGLISACLGITLIFMIIFYYLVRSAIKPTKRKLGKAIFRKRPRKREHSGVMSSNNSTTSIELSVTDME
ncbi:hypothetical protein NEHOM01_1788 [Nematocida homosporus]|uniref:uncharacterized protein n=1 Tax=Nematocida homosporus TaxID=1912981 RepID=UPI0022211099|nr:uncharacterized protein NEHOM01_1788 [Nematocida homosporus]KAI5186904.1 hypothetical protein NEHOM01_1788 [Nematocida homosporus]